jgi:hypothetical protein
MAPFGKAEAEIGGKDYILVFNFGAMAAIEQKADRSFQSIAAELSPNEDGTPKPDLKISTAALLLWGCFRAKHPNVSFDAAGEMLLGDEGPKAIEGLLACMANAFPEGDVANPPKRAKAGAGRTPSTVVARGLFAR